MSRKFVSPGPEGLRVHLQKVCYSI